VALLKRIIAESDAPGIILDPFMGSGSTLVAARELGRAAVGIEQDEQYCRIAAERIGGHVYQPDLLEPVHPIDPPIPDLFPSLPPVAPVQGIIKIPPYFAHPEMGEIRLSYAD
jgi:hypothetical protein